MTVLIRIATKSIFVGNGAVQSLAFKAMQPPDLPCTGQEMEEPSVQLHGFWCHCCCHFMDKCPPIDYGIKTVDRWLQLVGQMQPACPWLPTPALHCCFNENIDGDGAKIISKYSISISWDSVFKTSNSEIYVFHCIILAHNFTASHKNIILSLDSCDPHIQ